MLAAGQLDGARAMQVMTMTETCAVERDVAVGDGAGGEVLTPGVVDTLFCRVAPTRLSERESLMALGLQSAAVFRVTVPAESDVRVTDRLSVGGTVYEVMAVQGPGTLETARVCLCVKR